MTKRSGYAKARKAEQNARMIEAERAWRGSIPPDVAAAFEAQVKAARERGPLPPKPDMAPGTPPRPPRPGREPKAPKQDDRPRRRSM
jgi:hypothetical protein